MDCWEIGDVPQFREETDEMVKLVSQQRVATAERRERISRDFRELSPGAHLGPRPSQWWELAPRERVQKRTAEQTEDAPQYPEETVEMVRSVSHERVQQRAAEQTRLHLRKRPSRWWGRSHINECNSEPPNRLRIRLHLRKRPAEMAGSVSHEQVQQRAAEQTEDAPPSPAEVVEAVTLVPHESEVVASGMSERHRLVTLGVYVRRWTWSNTSTTMARLRKKFG